MTTKPESFEELAKKQHTIGILDSGRNEDKEIIAYSQGWWNAIAFAKKYMESEQNKLQAFASYGIEKKEKEND